MPTSTAASAANVIAWFCTAAARRDGRPLRERDLACSEPTTTPSSDRLGARSTGTAVTGRSVHPLCQSDDNLRVMAIQAADAFLEYAVRDTLDALELAAEDEAAKQLAIRYARMIDQSGGSDTDGRVRPDTVLWHLGPELLRCLESLGATPAARAAISPPGQTGGENATTAVSWLDQQRAARAAALRQTDLRAKPRRGCSPRR